MRLSAHFGQWFQVHRRGREVLRWQVAAGLIYGQVKKIYRRRKLVRVRHVWRLGTQADLAVALQGMGFSGRMNTAFIERVNLTVRPHHSPHVELVQPRERRGRLLAQRYRQRTPAMAVGRTNRRWTARDVLSYPLPPVSA